MLKIKLPEKEPASYKNLRYICNKIIHANEFQIDNNTTSFRGTARRMNQLGEGTKFPIGPLGQVHKFDLPRLGFNPVTKYEETYGPLTNSGLADTYTLESPIDDMYKVIIFV